MKMSAAAALLLFATSSYAQDITGTWQGTLRPDGRELRLVFRISNEGGSIRASGFSIDQSGQPIPVSVTQDGAVVKFAMVAIGATYEGRLSADGTTITGTFTQKQPTPLTLRRATPETAWAIPNAPSVLKPMDPMFTPTFDVATIKPSDPNQQGLGITVRGRTLETRNTSLVNLMAFAYQIHPTQVVGAPKWAEEERYDITAQPDGNGMPNERQLRTALQKLIAERFSLKFRREPRQLSAYVLTLRPGGHKLARSGGDPAGLPGFGMKGPGVMAAVNAGTGQFTQFLQAVVLDRPVVDRTGLTDRFDFTIEFMPDDSHFGGRGGQMAAQLQAAGGDARPGFFTALQEQLGLRLEAQRTAIEVLVIEEARPPSEN